MDEGVSVIGIVFKPAMVAIPMFFIGSSAYACECPRMPRETVIERNERISGSATILIEGCVRRIVLNAGSEDAVVEILPLSVLKGEAPSKIIVHTGAADEGASCGAASSFQSRLFSSKPLIFAASRIEGKEAEYRVYSCGIINDTGPVVFKKRKLTDTRCVTDQNQ